MAYPLSLIWLLPWLHFSSAVNIWNVGKPAGHIDVLESPPTPEIFLREYIRNTGGPFEGVGKPVLFRGAARPMPAFKKWTDDYLKKKHGKVIMDQVETEKHETRTKLPHDDWTLAKFLSRYNNSVLYSTATLPKGMDKEFYLLPSMNCGGFQRRLQSNVLWFSSGGTRSVIHKDGGHNIHCMLAGRKDWILWRPDEEIDTPAMGWINGEREAERNPEQFKDAYGTYVGKINVDDVDLVKFPKWGKLKWWRMALEEGDCAFIPGAWYHYVEAAAMRSISIHVWFGAPSKLDTKSCENLVDNGHNTSDYIVRLGDCTWGWNDPDKRVKQTKCKIQPPEAAEVKHGEL